MLYCIGAYFSQYCAHKKIVDLNSQHNITHITMINITHKHCINIHIVLSVSNREVGFHQHIVHVLVTSANIRTTKTQ